MELDFGILYLVALAGLIVLGVVALYLGQNDMANNIALGIIGFIGGGAIGKASASQSGGAA